MTPDRQALLRRKLDHAHGESCTCDWHALLDRLAALEGALAAIREERRVDGVYICPDWMRRDIDAALAHGDGR